MKISNGSSGSNSQLGSVRLLSLLLLLFTSSCGSKTEEQDEFSMSSVPRLMKYYDSVKVNGDTAFKIVPVQSFINQCGDTFSLAALKGNISVVQMFFTSCKGICPVISGSMAAVQKEFAGNSNVRLVSLSVDPARDSVPALKAYAQHYNCDSAQWTLLTGEKKKLYDQIRYGYQLPDIEPGDGGAEDFIHSDQLVLVDRNSIIRGYYGGTDTAQVRMLIEDIHTLLNEK